MDGADHVLHERIVPTGGVHAARAGRAYRQYVPHGGLNAQVRSHRLASRRVGATACSSVASPKQQARRHHRASCESPAATPTPAAPPTSPVKADIARWSRAFLARASGGRDSDPTNSPPATSTTSRRKDVRPVEVQRPQRELRRHRRGSITNYDLRSPRCPSRPARQGRLVLRALLRVAAGCAHARATASARSPRQNHQLGHQTAPPPTC